MMQIYYFNKNVNFKFFTNLQILTFITTKNKKLKQYLLVNILLIKRILLNKQKIY